MNPIRQHPRLAPLVLTLATAFAAQALLVTEVQARERSATASGPNGNSATRNVQRANGDVSSSTTTGDGSTLATRNVDRSASSTSGSATGPQGSTATRNTTRTQGGSSTVVTGPNGQSGGVAVTRKP